MSKFSFLPEGLLQNKKNLATLLIRWCPDLLYIAPHVSGCCTSLRSLIIIKCEKLSYLADGLHTLVSLEKLDIRSCPSLESIPSILGLTSLRELRIVECEKLSYLPSGLQLCTSLEILTISNCPNLISVPEDLLRQLRSLSRLDVVKCKKLKCLEEGLHCLTHLKCLGIGGFWEDLDSFPLFENILQLQQLRDLRLCGWPKLKSLPDQIQHLTALTSLEITEFDGVEALPEWLGNLSSLTELCISECKNLMYLPEAMGRITCLKKLDIGGFCEQLDSFPDLKDILQLQQLRQLWLCGWPKLKSLPDQLQHFTALTFLGISRFDGMEALPEWFGKLSALESLRIYDCKNLKYLPPLEAMGRLTKLLELVIVECPLLKERCVEDSGPEWSKISHIPDRHIILRN